tara:strand:- start:8766 stop:9275 length:510 start_codon:yes stop_codon:yes gene_type:complete
VAPDIAFWHSGEYPTGKRWSKGLSVDAGDEAEAAVRAPHRFSDHFLINAPSPPSSTTPSRRASLDSGRPNNGIFWRTCIMNSIRPPFLDGSDDEIVQTGKRFGYGNWLQPIINANDAAGDRSEQAPTVVPLATTPPHVPARRGRGRPRVTRPRDESAVEVANHKSSEAS